MYGSVENRGKSCLCGEREREREREREDEDKDFIPFLYLHHVSTLYFGPSFSYSISSTKTASSVLSSAKNMAEQFTCRGECKKLPPVTPVDSRKTAERKIALVIPYSDVPVNVFYAGYMRKVRTDIKSNCTKDRPSRSPTLPLPTFTHCI